ncbi:hypothetical protein CQ018_17450 [Arthrobacter sp. MYb227]|nr:hypothetical protein CQ018_17450 [Arthrobacter sp. MYb227]
MSRWREREEELASSIARSESVRLANHVLDLGEQLKSNEQKLDELVKVSEAAPLLEEKGFRAVTAAKCLVAWSHEGRVRNEAAFASLAGVNPIPASSGNTVRHRLNRGGDRRLNSALHMAAVSRMTHDTETCNYVEKRRAEGKTQGSGHREKIYSYKVRDFRSNYYEFSRIYADSRMSRLKLPSD